MRVLPTALEGVVVIEPEVHRDGRGFLLETYHRPRYRAAGIRGAFVQDNHTWSAEGVLRGLHAQLRPQGKLVRVLRGEVFDVAADARPSSPTFRCWVAVTLAEESFRQLWVPPGFLHGFCVLRGPAEVEYKCTDVYRPAEEIGVRWDDPDLTVDWPVSDPVLSRKDAALPTLAQLVDRLRAHGW